jgi:hypothetical protein
MQLTATAAAASPGHQRLVEISYAVRRLRPGGASGHRRGPAAAQNIPRVRRPGRLRRVRPSARRRRVVAAGGPGAARCPRSVARRACPRTRTPGDRRSGRGGTGDRDAYARNHVVARLRRNAGAIRRNDLAIMLECGNNDCFNLHDGTEYLHRALRDLDVSHDYHLIRGADHVGPGELSDMGPLFQSLAHPPLGPTLPTPSPPARVTRPRCPVGRRPGDRRFRRECRRAPQAWHYR